MTFYLHENIRYHVCLTLTQVGFGLQRHFSNQPDTDEPFHWVAGLPAQNQLRPEVLDFLKTYLFPHFQKLFQDEDSKEVVEKVLECVRDLADELGPSGIEAHLDLIMGSVEQLLEKSARCQISGKGNNMDDSDEENPESSEESDEDLDHDEIILGNATDVLISVSKALGDSFLPLFGKIAPKLVKYLGDEHPKSDKIMVIGCLSEIMNNCPSAINSYFDEFFKVIMQHSGGTDGQMNRNCSYSIGILCQKAPEKFKQHLKQAMDAVQLMHTKSDAADAKDNCVATLIRILDHYPTEFPEQVYNDLFNRVMSVVPFEADPTENETVIKFCMNANNLQAGRLEPHMEKITLTALKILVDSRLVKDIDESFKLLTVKFIKNVIVVDEGHK